MKKARYNRISTPNQKIERQLAKKHPDELIFNDVVSGSIPFAERPMGVSLLEAVENEKIDYVSVSSVDRLGRNINDILDTLDYFTKNQVILKVDNLGIESMIKEKPNQVFKLIVSVLGNVADGAGKHS